MTKLYLKDSDEMYEFAEMIIEAWSKTNDGSYMSCQVGIA